MEHITKLQYIISMRILDWDPSDSNSMELHTSNSGDLKTLMKVPGILKP
jgi:hypothetical protein